MPNKKNFLYIAMWFLCVAFSSSHAQEGDGFGQIIQIHTRFHSFIGKPTWLLIIRDLDHDQTIPYLYDIRRGDNQWLAFTYGRDYLITVSKLSTEIYNAHYNKFRQYKTNDFCDLESNGRIMRGESIIINIEGDLSPDSNTYTCHVLRYSDPNFLIVPALGE